MFEEPEIHIFDFSGLPGARDYKAERARIKAEAGRRYTAVVEDELLGLGCDPNEAERWASMVIDRLFFVRDVVSGKECPYGCHPSLPGDAQDFGFACTCRLTVDERERRRREERELWRAETEARRSSPEGRQAEAERQAKESELVGWLAGDPGVVITKYGGWAPEQWSGSVDGHSFFFRERHDEWRIELDLEPTGDFSKVYVGGDLDDPNSFRERSVDRGEVIAEGVANCPGYGGRPVERARFIVQTIREHLERQTCELHTGGSADLERRFGIDVRWCPACGAHLQ